MAGYSGTPLPQKLGIKPGAAVLLRLAPTGFALDPLPPDVKLSRNARGPFDVIVLFARNRAVLLAELAHAMAKLKPDGGLWVAWPKKASGELTDLQEGTVRTAGLEARLVDNKICAIDETWSGLRFVYRLRDRAEVASMKRRPSVPARPSRRRP
ncbi:MAG TPA: DUF3052 domain-containing protein [Candidatus Eisenbacteria bacterium]|nr:DUF3052 domain-containing protein [Candidatus Eisenbacteria bacterium]